VALLSWLKSQKTSKSADGNLLTSLIDDYREEMRMIHQLQDHAQRAPYPQMAEKLQALAEEERKQAETLKERISSLGGSVDQEALETKSGWNHWERLMVDLDDERTQRTRYQDQAILSGIEALDLREQLLEFAQEEARHINVLRDLILRSDPHAGR
jgi:bacterioferritin (cytochrome b1)